MDVHELVTTRIAELRGEFAAGEARLAKLDAEQAQLRETLLRIDGALLALNELLQVPALQSVEHGNGHTPSRHPTAPNVVANETT